MNLEKAFLDASGRLRKGFNGIFTFYLELFYFLFLRHMLSAPSLYNQYGGDGFPALSDSIFNAVSATSGTDVKPLWEEVKKQLSIVIYVIQSGSSILNAPNNFDRYIKNK